ncbi:MAG TPA: hypothetical protein DF984_04590, partial [Anaerolineaceae bacterium]|nr:hypothetical protein [Anaerolineaceae bacterium]
NSADEKGPAVGSQLNPNRIALGAEGSLYISDPTSPNGRVFRVHPAFKGFDLGDILIASEDGTLLYHFSSVGRHLKTLNALTGATIYAFGYDINNLLITITDGDNNVTTVERDGNGNPTAILGPYGQRTVLALNGNGYLASVANPAGETTQFGYGTEGLLTSVTGARGTGFTYSMTYDSLGRLIQAEDPAGGSTTLNRTDTANGHQIDKTTAMGLTGSYLSETLLTGIKHYHNIFQDGTAADSLAGRDGVVTTTLPDGTTTTNVPGPDPRFGMQAPLSKSNTVTTGGLTSITAAIRTAVLTDINDPLTLTSLTDTNTLNDRIFTTGYNAATRTSSITSPMGRERTYTTDMISRITLSQVLGQDAINYGYNSRGRLIAVTTGSGTAQRLAAMSYNAEGFLESITNPLTQTTQFIYDLAGRATRQTFPDNSQVQKGYDGHGNLTSLITPRGHSHAFSYSPVDLVTSYTAPGNTTTSYSYNKDRQLTRITRPEGTSLDFAYDTSGRLEALTLPGASQITRSYDGTTGQLSSIKAADGGTLSFGYSGGLLASETWAGPVAGNVSRTYDNDFRISDFSINGGTFVSFQYDDDSLLTAAGEITLNRSAQNGLLTGTTILGGGTATDTFSYNEFGEHSSYDAAYNSTSLYAAQYTRDKLGRISQKTETTNGASHAYDYAYDSVGRLVDVKKDNVTVSTYSYDNNGNRITGPGGITGVYDAQDRLTAYGATAYQYTANGELQNKTTGGQTATYQYDALGNLLSITRPNPQPKIEYIVDGLNRRIGKKVGGTFEKGFLYIDALHPVAELDNAGNVSSVFVYGSRANVPDYMIKSGVRYRIVSDHLGSPRIVVNVDTGVIVQRMDYDEFGNVIQDTSPGFQPFGFAGGLYDPDTGLVRFGARDYDAETGRWTAKDPILFKGGSANLYAYASNDPINLVDPYGMGPNWGTVGIGTWQFLSGAWGTFSNVSQLIVTSGTSVLAWWNLGNSLISVPYGAYNFGLGFLNPQAPAAKPPDLFNPLKEWFWEQATSSGSSATATPPGMVTATSHPADYPSAPYNAAGWTGAGSPGTGGEWMMNQAR